MPAGVLIAAVATGLGALPLVAGIGETTVPTGALYGAGWSAFGVAAALVLGSGTARRVGRVLVLLALVPAAMVLVALPAASAEVWTALADRWDAVDVLVVALTLALLAWAMGYAPGRAPRRRLFWVVVSSGVVFGVVVVADSALSARAEAVVLTVCLWSLAGLVTRLVYATELRPVDEPLLDALAAASTLATGAVVGVLLWLSGTRAGIPAPDLVAVFVGTTSAVLAWPAAVRWRRSWLSRRYGTGTLNQADVATITADLHHLTDPRELLAKAAEMVAASSGHAEVTLVMGEDIPEVPAGCADHPLLVGGDRVGTLLVDSDDPEGPEPRQARMVEQLLPTVGLVVRAVGLAVEAEHARQDVARERDVERARILGDLHDGLGPVLAGMSMRVQAELRRRPTPLLVSLASELAQGRGDLRRIVSGLTPSALHDADLAGALRRLVATFEGDGRHVGLELAVQRPPTGDRAVAVYRFVAEGITNALRHGQASHVAVRVATTAAGHVAVDVRDDGVGGPIAPGVGLTSLRQRAEQLGGSLAVGPYEGGGVLLHVELPTEGAA